MNNRRMAIWMTAGVLLLAAQAFSQSEKFTGHGRAVVTILSKQHGEVSAEVSPKDVSIKVNGKPATVTSWAPLRGLDARLELVLLIDSSARESLGSQFNDITHCHQRPAAEHQGRNRIYAERARCVCRSSDRGSRRGACARFTCPEARRARAPAPTSAALPNWQELAFRGIAAGHGARW